MNTYQFEVEYLDGTTHIETIQIFPDEETPNLTSAYVRLITKLSNYSFINPSLAHRRLDLVANISLIR